MAVEAARRPWIEDTDGSTTERRDSKEVISSSRRRAPAKVKKLEKENEALRELVRRFRTELCGGVSAIPPIAIGTMKPAPAVGALRHPSPRPASAAGSFCSEVPSIVEAVDDPTSARVSAALSAWASEEPLAAAIGSWASRPPYSAVPALDFSRLMELLEDEDDEEEEEEEETDRMDDEFEDDGEDEDEYD
ncbi:unnamed protein product [Polarella glacialis]|nr:unnamed protein product [Polarella glacialis]